MKIIRRLGVAGLTAVAALAIAGATTTTAHAGTPKHTVEGVQEHVEARVDRITAKMETLKPRIAANPRFSAATKTTLSADIAKVLTDTETWRKKIDAATTMEAVKAATPARDAVLKDLAKLQADLKTARAGAGGKH